MPKSSKSVKSSRGKSSRRVQADGGLVVDIKSIIKSRMYDRKISVEWRGSCTCNYTDIQIGECFVVEKRVRVEEAKPSTVYLKVMSPGGVMPSFRAIALTGDDIGKEVLFASNQQVTPIDARLVVTRRLLDR